MSTHLLINNATSASTGLGLTLGALESGVLFSIFFFGMVTVQVYTYYDRFPRDPWSNRFLVASVWICDLVHTICICYTTYIATITFNGRFEELATFPGIYASLLFGGLVTLQVQVFFAVRVWKIVGKYFAVFCIALSALRFAASIVAVSEGFAIADYRIWSKRLGWLAIALFVLGAVIDMLVAISLCWVLKKQRLNAYQKTGGLQIFDSVHRHLLLAHVLDGIIAWTIQTGLVTSFTSVALAITLIVMPDNLVWLSLCLLSAKLYSNSLLASLNSRAKLREVHGVVDPVISTKRNGNSRNLSFSPMRPVEIVRSTQVDQVFDSDVFGQAKYETHLPLDSLPIIGNVEGAA